MNCKSYETFFLNMANRTKLDIILALKDSPLSVNHLSGKLRQEQSKISHNLKRLASCNIVKFKREGKYRIYSLNKDTVTPLIELVEKHVSRHCRKECCKR